MQGCPVCPRAQGRVAVELLFGEAAYVIQCERACVSELAVTSVHVEGMACAGSCATPSRGGGYRCMALEREITLTSQKTGW